MATESDTVAVAASDEDRELGTKPVHGLFVKYSLITLIGMAAQAVMVILEGTSYLWIILREDFRFLTQNV